MWLLLSNYPLPVTVCKGCGRELAWPNRSCSVSVRVAHQKGCANASTSLKSVEIRRKKIDGRSAREGTCKTCSPSFYVFERLRDGKVKKHPRVKDLDVADRFAHRRQVELDEGQVGIARAKQVTREIPANQTIRCPK